MEGIMLKYTIASLILIISTCESQAQVDGKVILRVCNGDKSSQISLAINDTHGFTASTDGWFYVEPNTCRDFFRETGSNSIHSLFVSRRGSKKTMYFTGVNTGGRKFCVNYNDEIDLFESIIVSPGRTTKCQGAETLEYPSFYALGRSGGVAQFNISPFTDTSDGNGNARTGQDCGPGQVRVWKFCL